MGFAPAQKDAAPAPKARIARSSSEDSSVATQETLQAGINPRSSETILFVPKAEQNFADFDVRPKTFDHSLHGLPGCLTLATRDHLLSRGSSGEARLLLQLGPFANLLVCLLLSAYAKKSDQNQ